MRVFHVLLASLLHAASAVSQAGNSDQEIAEATVRLIAEKGFSHEAGAAAPWLMIDPRVFARSETGIGQMDRTAPLHSAAWRSGAAVSLLSEVVSATRADACRGIASGDCLTNGKSVVVSLGQPTIKGDSAVVDVYVRVANFISPADSAAIVKRPAGAASLHFARGYAFVGYVILRKQVAMWVAQRLVVTSST
jgi:hypothetical protein